MSHAITGLIIFFIVSAVMLAIGYAYWQGVQDGRHLLERRRQLDGGKQ